MCVSVSVCVCVCVCVRVRVCVCVVSSTQQRVQAKIYVQNLILEMFIFFLHKTIFLFLTHLI